MAVVSAVAARLVLRRSHVLIRFLAALAVFLVGLYILGIASHWKYGIGPYAFWPRSVDWNGIAHVGIGLYLCLLVFRAWRRPPPQIIEVMPRSIEPESLELNMAPAPSPAVKRIPRLHSGQGPAFSLNHVFTPAEPSVRVRRSTRRRRKGAIKTITAADLPVRPRARGRARGRARVQFAVVEEHRCPFCLETVSRADPRGVVECDVCHALHHKDCWDITGVCQVPHLNS
jgi:hypothetical protein